jgi:hypothetical protein
VSWSKMSRFCSALGHISLVVTGYASHYNMLS